MQTLKSFEVGCVSTAYLSNIISTLAGKSSLNQWRIGLRILHVRKSNFIKFDITDFYSSISENHLSRAISYARTIIFIKDTVIHGIKLAQKLLVFSKEGTLVKRCENL